MKSTVFFDSVMGLKSRIVINADKFTINPGDVKGWFELIEKPQIEVGSEWATVNFDNGFATVKYVGDHKVFIQWDDGSEGERLISEFHSNFKPKPKTVTMYFYKTTHGYVAYSDKHPFDAPEFTKEIEL